MKQHGLFSSFLADIGSVETLAQALVLYKTVEMSASSKSYRTRIEYENDVGDLISYLTAGGIVRSAQVTLAHLKIYQSELERRGLKPATRNRKSYAIKGFFTFLRDYALVKDDIARNLIPPPAERGEPRFLSEDEYTRLLQTCSSNLRDKAIVQLFLQTGIRLSELVGLSVNDVTLPSQITPALSDFGVIRIHRSGRDVTIPLNYKAANSLKEWLELRKPMISTALFLTALKLPLGKRSVQLMLEKYLAEAGIENASVQSLRHTMAVHHLAKGTPLKTLAEILGDDIKTMQIYVTLVRRIHQRAVHDHAL